MDVIASPMVSVVNMYMLHHMCVRERIIIYEGTTLRWVGGWATNRTIKVRVSSPNYDMYWETLI